MEIRSEKDAPLRGWERLLSLDGLSEIKIKDKRKGVYPITATDSKGRRWESYVSPRELTDAFRSIIIYCQTPKQNGGNN